MLGECIALPADIGKESECRRLADVLAEREPSVDILVNNAGANWFAPIATHDDAAWDKVLAVNLKGVFHLTRFLLPLLEVAATDDDPARIINVGSVSGLKPDRFETYAYGASKAGVHLLTRQLARDLAPRITVNAIAPGPFPTDMISGDAFAGDLLDSTALRRLGQTGRRRRDGHLPRLPGRVVHHRCCPGPRRGDALGRLLLIAGLRTL